MTSKSAALLAACLFSCCILPALSLLTCNVNVKKGLSDAHPLLLHRTSDEFFYPNKCNSERIKLQFCDTLRVACTEGDLQVYGKSLRRTAADLTCYGVNLFRVGRDFLASPLKNVTCPSAPAARLARTDLGCPKGVTARVAFPMANGRWASTIDTICHDEASASTNWLHHKLPGAIENRQVLDEVPEFATGPFYNDTVLDSSVFARDSQRARLLALTANQALVDRVIPAMGGDVLVPGMLAPVDDMFYRKQQRSVYYYVNTVPVWKSIDDGNWRQVGNAVRNLAGRTCRTLDVYSGGLDALAYSNSMGAPVSFTLTTTNEPMAPRPAVTVPRYLFKYVVDRAKNQALVFVTINDPMGVVPPVEPLCPEHKECSDRYPEFKLPLLGYTYCCTVAQGSGIAKRLADLGVPIYPNAQPLSLGGKEAADPSTPALDDIFSNFIQDLADPDTLDSTAYLDDY